MNKPDLTVFVFSHTAARRGYTKVAKIGTFENYSGKYGEGYIRLNGKYRGSTIYESISYYIKNKGA